MVCLSLSSSRKSEPSSLRCRVMVVPRSPSRRAVSSAVAGSTVKPVRPSETHVFASSDPALREVTETVSATM